MSTPRRASMLVKLLQCFRRAGRRMIDQRNDLADRRAAEAGTQHGPLRFFLDHGQAIDGVLTGGHHHDLGIMRESGSERFKLKFGAAGLGHFTWLRWDGNIWREQPAMANGDAQ